MSDTRPPLPPFDNDSAAIKVRKAEDGIRDAQESRGLGDVYKRQDGSGIVVKRWKWWSGVAHRLL